MEQYIKKSALVAEIKRLIKHSEMVADHNTQITELVSRELDALYHLISFLNTLEVKEVDIRSEVSNWWNSHYAGVKQGYTFEGYSGHYLDNSTIVNLAQYFYELGMAESNKSQKGE